MKVAAGKKYSVMACPVRNAAVPVSDGRSGVPGFVPARPRLRQQSSARPRIVGPLRWKPSAPPDEYGGLRIFFIVEDCRGRVIAKKAAHWRAAFRFCRPCKPGSVLRLPGVPIIYLGRRSPGASSNLPPGIGRATLDCRYTWSCNPRDVLSEAYRYLRGGLLPRLFTLTPAGRLFSVTLAIPSRISSR